MIKISDSRTFAKAFRHLLCEERKKRGTSQFELARRSGLTRQCISLLESGRRVPTFFSMFNLAKGFDMSLSKFIFLLINKIEYYECRENLLLVANSKKARWKS
jgi:transcriptional regulator with XRE-family HTH domain